MSSPLPAVATLGHLIGSYRTEDAPASYLRVGAAYHQLSATEFADWLRTRTAGAPVGSGPLAGRGLVVTVPADPAGRTAFADAHRLVPLMVQLGNVSPARDVIWLGRRGSPVVGVPLAVALVWWLSPVTATLGQACAAVADELGAPAADILDPVLASLPGLLAADAAYLDEPWSGPPLPPYDGPVFSSDVEGELFPVGHYGGVIRDVETAAPIASTARVGADDVEFATALDVAVWEAAHGENAAAATLTRAGLAGRAGSGTGPLRDARPDAVGAAVDRLLAAGLLVAARPERAEELTAAFRLQFLHSGLGNVHGSRLLFEIGVAGGPSFAAVGRLGRDLWQNGWFDRSLRDTVVRLGEAGPEESLATVRKLLAAGVAYLDVAR